MIDVCLMLEGTYPYVSGGVSTWVHQLISSMKDIRFGIVYIAAYSDPTRSIKYELPQNVIYLSEVCLHDYALEKRAKVNPRKKDYDALENFYDRLFEGSLDGFEQIVPLFRGEKPCFDFQNFFSSEKIWSGLTKYYERFAPALSFLDFFWTWRGTHLPLLQIMTAELPHARIYHAISTGYAGLLGVLAKLEYGEKFFLTEHGIYTHERMLEIAQASWIYEREKMGYRAEKELSLFKKWWLGIFKTMSGLSYRYADRMFTLYEGNRIREMLEGANPKKIAIIPNGIDVHAFASIPREKRAAPCIGFVGRVVSIKDPKTFIQAARLVLDRVPDAQFYIIGPLEEEVEYVEECKMLVDALQLDANIRFTGAGDVKEYYKFLDIVVLTSISEAQPYVILEAGAAGIPIVASDVGACREMLEGRGAEDSAIGQSGLVTEVSNPESTADAIIKLILDPPLYKRCSEAGKIRVERNYNQSDLLSRYLNVYEQGM